MREKRRLSGQLPSGRTFQRRAALLVIVAFGVVAAGCGSGAPKLGFSPTPGSAAASPQSQLSVRGAPASELSDVVMIGSRSGRHAGELRPYSDGRGASFVPTKRFDPGERVEVTVRMKNGSKNARFDFTVARPAEVPVTAGPPGKPTQRGQIQSFHSRPDLRPPTVAVSERMRTTSSGDIFVGPSNKLGQAGPMILDTEGRTVWFYPLPGKTQAFDFRMQRYEGKPVLTWWQGIVTSRGYGAGEDVIFDSSYRQMATVRAGNGYQADIHDFVITPQGTALVLAYNPVRADLSSVGGPRDGTVLDGVIQEIDIRTGLVLFEWHSLGHVALDESYAKPAHDGLLDYFHVNSVDLDGDGNLLVSARNTWAVYKINRQTGQIMWRLGGKKSSFRMESGTRFAYQHDARRQPDGTITLFDNGADPKINPESRGIALKLDMRNATRGHSEPSATLARQWTHPKKVLAGSQGNMQTLPNGDRFIGWGAQPNLTEFSSSGRVLFEAALAAPDTSYRAYRFPWNASPAGKPAIATTAQPGGKLTVYASWNGATNVFRWRILAGSSKQSLAPIATATRTGFETTSKVATHAKYLAVQAEDSSGRSLGTSQAVSPGASAR
jgi:hypothetical protein